MSAGIGSRFETCSFSFYELFTLMVASNIEGSVLEVSVLELKLNCDTKISKISVAVDGDIVLKENWRSESNKDPEALVSRRVIKYVTRRG